MWQCGNMKILLCLKIGLRRAIWKTGEQHCYSRRLRRQPGRFILAGNDAEENY